MTNPTFSFRLHPDARLFLEAAYAKKRKQVEGQGLSASFADTVATKSFGAWLVHQAYQKTQADQAAADQVAAAAELDRKKAKPKVSGQRGVKGRKDRKRGKR